GVPDHHTPLPCSAPCSSTTATRTLRGRTRADRGFRRGLAAIARGLDPLVEIALRSPREAWLKSLWRERSRTGHTAIPGGSIGIGSHTHAVDEGADAPAGPRGSLPVDAAWARTKCLGPGAAARPERGGSRASRL